MHKLIQITFITISE